MYDIILNDATGSTTLPEVEVPLQVTTLEGVADVQTLDFNVYTDFITTKRVITHTWAYMSLDDYAILKGYYDRQFTSFQYPNVTITDLGIASLICRMTLNAQQIIDNCGTVQGVTITLRETKQNAGS